METLQSRQPRLAVMMVLRAKIQDELDKTGEKPFCGIHIIDTHSGNLREV